jgi:hypothetical protein
MGRAKKRHISASNLPRRKTGHGKADGKPGHWRRLRAAIFLAGKFDMVKWRRRPSWKITEGSLLLLQKMEKLQSKRRRLSRIGKNRRGEGIASDGFHKFI